MLARLAVQPFSRHSVAERLGVIGVEAIKNLALHRWHKATKCPNSLRYSDLVLTATGQFDTDSPPASNKRRSKRQLSAAMLYYHLLHPWTSFLGGTPPFCYQEYTLNLTRCQFIKIRL